MYFNENNKNNTNIDSEFNNDNILSRILKLLNKYKIIIIIAIILIIGIILFLTFFNKKDEIITNYLILNGEENITLYQGADYIEPGFDAYNSKNENLNNNVEIISTLDTSKIGNYEISYTIGDVTKVRKITIIDKPEEYTYIYLKTINNSVNIYIKINETYTEPGYQVFSSTGQNLTSQVEITGSVDTSKKGNYKLIYSVVDSNGVTVSTSRTVIVMDTEISLSLSTDEYTNKDVTINIGVADNYFDYILLPDNTKITTNTYEYKVSSNGKYTFKTYNKKGVEKEASIEVKNIDKEVPTGSCSGSYKNGVSTITVTSKDNIDISKYIIKDKAYTNNKITLNQELKTVTVTIYDISGNTKEISCTLTNKNTSSSSSSSSSSSKSSSSSSSKNSSSSSSGNYTPIQTTKNISVNYYKSFTYWLYLPDNVTKNLPIVVYLPGLGERGNDYYSGAKTAIAYGPINEIKDYNHSYNAIIIHMQVPSNGSVYNYLSDYITLINQIANKYSANKNKISIIGFSHGCYGLVNMIESYPKYFSAAVFVGCSPNKRIDIKKYTYQPIWTFVGGGDGTSDYSDQYGSHYSLENFVDSINKSGGNAKHTSVKNKANVHNIMNDSYSILRDNDYKVINWMISQ